MLITKDQTILKVWKTTIDSTDTGLLTNAILSAVLFVAENLIQQKAVIFPWACQVFLHIYCNDQPCSMPIQLTLEVGENNVRFTSQWLLNQLILYLNQLVYFIQMHAQEVWYCAVS